MFVRSLTLLSLALALPTTLATPQKMLQVQLESGSPPSGLLENSHHELKSMFLQVAHSQIPISLTSDDNITYTSKFLFGSKKIKANLVYDTQTDWTMVSDISCTNNVTDENCYSQLYNPSASTTSLEGSYINETVNAFVGDSYNDTVCLYNRTYCVSNFSFLSGHTCFANATVALDGYMGIAPDDPVNGPSFIVSLYNQGFISDKVITIRLVDATKAVVTFGGVDPRADNTSILYYEINDNTKWQLDMQDFMFGNYSIFDVNTAYSDVLIDSFIRPILVPSAIFDNMVAYFNETMPSVTCNSTTETCYFLNKCSTKMKQFQNITIQLTDSYGLVIPPQSYLIDKLSNQGHNACLIGIQKSKDDKYVLGERALMNYYVIFDLTNKKVGFTGNYVAHDLPVVDVPEDGMSGLAVLVIIILIGVILGAIGAFIYVKMRNKRLRGNLETYEELDNKQ